MSSGDTFLAQVEAGLNTTIASARVRRQFPSDIMLKVADRQTLPKGTGTTWYETVTENLTAQNYGETDTIDNAQQLEMGVLSGEPQLVALKVFIGERVKARLSPKSFATLGQTSQDAMDKKKNTDGHALFAAATTTLGGTGTTAKNGHILAGATRIASDATEGWRGPIAAVVHGYTLYDLQTEVLAGIATYPVPKGMTEDTFRQGLKGQIGGATVFQDDLITIDSTPDTRGGIFASGPGGAVILVQGLTPWRQTKDRPEAGYGGVDVYLKDEYLWVERSTGNWLYGHLADATAPTG